MNSILPGLPPPCPTHSTVRRATVLNPYKDNTRQIENGGGHKVVYPDMTLYQEIILLENFFRGKYCIENVIAYYKPLIPPLEMSQHWFWTNFLINPLPKRMSRGHHDVIEVASKRKGFDLSKFTGIDKRKVLRNAVEPETGLHILKCAIKSPSLFPEIQSPIAQSLFS